MNQVLRRISRALAAHIDGPLLTMVLLLMGVGLIVIFSGSNQNVTRISTQMVSMLVALGVMYARGEGVNKDAVQSYKWFKLASLSGLAEADVKLKEIEKSLDPKQIKEGDVQALQWRSQHK